MIRKAHLSLRFGWAKNVDFEMGNKVFEVGIFSHMYKFIYTTMVFWNYKFHYFSLTLHHLQVYYIWFEKDEINYCRTGCIKQNSKFAFYQLSKPLKFSCERHLCNYEWNATGNCRVYEWGCNSDVNIWFRFRIQQTTSTFSAIVSVSWIGEYSVCDSCYKLIKTAFKIVRC